MLVAPHVGAWIEILMKERFRAKAESHPTWVRGLKSLSLNAIAAQARSHPTWVRGLKFNDWTEQYGFTTSHPTWVRGLK